MTGRLQYYAHPSDRADDPAADNYVVGDYVSLNLGAFTHDKGSAVNIPADLALNHKRAFAGDVAGYDQILANCGFIRAASSARRLWRRRFTSLAGCLDGDG